jgi:hypothetical protein
VLADAPDLVPADAGNPDAMPWEVPDPVELQGIDCAAKCSSVPADASTPLPGPDASEPPLPGPDAGEPPLPGPDAGEPAKTGGGCTQGLAPMAVGTLAAALLALVASGAPPSRMSHVAALAAQRSSRPPRPSRTLRP